MIITCRSSTVFCNPDGKKVGGWQVSPIYLTTESITKFYRWFLRDLGVGSCITHSKKVLKSELFSHGRPKKWDILIFSRTVGNTGISQELLVLPRKYSTTIHAVYFILSLNQICWNVVNYKAHLVCYDILSLLLILITHFD